jgi:hypothetical protein
MMSGNDAANGTGRPAITIYETQSGVVAHITPVNLPTLRAVQLKAADLFPYPDKKPYQKPEENGFSDNQMTPAEDNPQYLADCAAVDAQRKTWADRAIFDYAVRFPKYPTPQDLVAGFMPQLISLRKIANLPDDDYEAVLFHIVLTWNQPTVDENNKLAVAANEYGRLIQLAIQTVALTPDEVTAGIRFFRPVLSERAAGRVAR